MKYKIYMYSTAFDCWTIIAIDIKAQAAIRRCKDLRNQGIRCYIMQEDNSNVAQLPLPKVENPTDQIIPNQPPKTFIQRILKKFRQKKKRS